MVISRPPDITALPPVEGFEAVDRPTHLGRGWDNDLWLVGHVEDRSRVILRSPHRELGRRALSIEIATLGRLRTGDSFIAPRLLAVIPAGDPLGPSALMTWIEGETIADSMLRGGPDVGLRWAPRLAHALADVHVPASRDVPRGPHRGVPITDRAEDTRARIQHVRDIGEDVGVGPAELDVASAALEDGVAAPCWSGPDLTLHGDPHPANLVARPDGIPGLIDWGDACAGDPASDLGQLYLLDPSGAALDTYIRAAAVHGIRHDAPALAARSRAWAARFCVLILEHSAGGGDGALPALDSCSRGLLRAWAAGDLSTSRSRPGP